MIIPILVTGVGVGLLTWILVSWGLRKGTGESIHTRENRGALLNLCRAIGRAFYDLAPDSWLTRNAEQDTDMLVKAGFGSNWLKDDVLGVQVVGAMVGWLVAGTVFSAGGVIPEVIGICLGWWLPRRQLENKRRERQIDLVRDFPTAIDIIMLGLEGGLDFAAGMRELVANADEGPVREEFSTILQDVSAGKSRVEAMRALSDRVDSLEIRTVVTSLIQAMELGAGVVETLRVQAEQLRANRLTRAEEAANKVPTKMLGPMFLFIMPAVLLVVFAPLAVSIGRSFSSFAPR